MDNIEKQNKFFQYECIRKSAYGIGYAYLKEACDKHEQERRRFLAENRTYTITFDKKETLRFICYYKVIDTVEKINKGVRIVAIDWFSVVYRGNSFYDLKILCWVVNSFDDINVKTAIVDEVHRQLQLKLKTNENDNAECFIEYLKSYKEMLVLDATYMPPAPQQQEQIYCIPTKLTKPQLLTLLGSLKENGFVAQEQTEEDFLNAFNTNAPKQGTIKWIKTARNRGVSPKQIVHFCGFMVEDKWLERLQNAVVVDLLSVIFGISTDNKRISSIRKEGAAEYDAELQGYIKIARNSAK